MCITSGSRTNTHTSRNLSIMFIARVVVTPLLNLKKLDMLLEARRNKVGGEFRMKLRGLVRGTHRSIQSIILTRQMLLTWLPLL